MYICINFFQLIQQFVLPSLLCLICKGTALYGEQKFSLNAF